MGGIIVSEMSNSETTVIGDICTGASCPTWHALQIGYFPLRKAALRSEANV